MCTECRWKSTDSRLDRLAGGQRVDNGKTIYFISDAMNSAAATAADAAARLIQKASTISFAIRYIFKSDWRQTKSKLILLGT